MFSHSVYIPAVDGKDLLLSCLLPTATETGAAIPKGFSLRRADGDLNRRRFHSVLDDSLELRQLAEVYQKVYRNRRFTTCIDGKFYCRSVIRLSFTYSIKEFNRLPSNLYLRCGQQEDGLVLADCACVQNGVLVAVQTEAPVKHPLPADLLAPYFYLEDGVYKAKSNIKTLISVADIRRQLYEDGFDCDGIHYVRYKRSSGSSRVGKCLFIDEKLYSRMHRWSLAGLSLNAQQEIDLAAWESYLALPLSSIIDTLTIAPENFLVLSDYESVFTEEAAVVHHNEGQLKAKVEPVEIRNRIWDGQSLLDPSLFPERFAQYSMVLLRNRFFKSACFQCSLQQYFQDHGITELCQLNGRTVAQKLSDIKIITSESSIKYLKFGPLENWFHAITQSPEFGIVKHEKPTPFYDGTMAQTHYQLLNTLQLDYQQTEALLAPSLKYLTALRESPAVLRHHLHHQMSQELTGAALTSAIVYQLLGITDQFSQTKLYDGFLRDLLKSQKQVLRLGHVLVPGNYSTLLGNPLEMLAAACGNFDGASSLPAGHIHTTAFPPGTTLLGVRSPHVTMGNLWLAKNVWDSQIQRYFHLTDEILCVNSIGENLLMRLSGADFDSDAVLLTDHPLLVEAARKNYQRFPVPTNLVTARKKLRYPTNQEQAELDITASVNKIGEIVNLSQELNSLLWHQLSEGASFSKVEELYLDAAILDVLSGIEIDKAKREYTIDTVAELSRIKEKYARTDAQGRGIKPYFFRFLAMDKGYYNNEKKCYQTYNTTMDHLQHILNKYRHKKRTPEFLPFSQLVIPQDYCSSKVSYRQVHQILELVRIANRQVKEIWNNTDLSGSEKYQQALTVQQETAQDISTLRLNPSTMYKLLNLIEAPECQDVQRKLFTLLFSTANESFFQLIAASRTPIGQLIPDESGEISLHGHRFRLSAETANKKTAQTTDTQV